MQSREEIKTKIAKLLALGASDHRAEAEAAIAKAHSLMLAYAIEEHELHGSEERRFGEKLLRKGKTRSVQHKLVCGIITDYFNVKVISYRLKHEASVTYAFGTETNCEFAQYVHDFLLATYDRLWEVYKQENCFMKLDSSHSRSFYYGLSDGFRSTLAVSTNNFIANVEVLKQTALALIRTDLEESFKRVHPKVREDVVKFRTDKHKKFIRDIYKRGVHEGKKIRVRRAVGSDHHDSP